MLKGNQFVGATQIVFNYGVSSGTQCVLLFGQCTFSDITNGPLTAVPYAQCDSVPATPNTEVTDDISASVMLNYGTNAEQNQANNGRQSQQTIQIDNPFLPASIRQQMIAGGIPSITLGTAANEDHDGGGCDQRQRRLCGQLRCKAIGQNYIQNYRQLMRGVFTLEGGYHLFGEDWSWNAYAQHTSGARMAICALPKHPDRRISTNAVDAVTVTPQPAGTRWWRADHHTRHTRI